METTVTYTGTEVTPKITFDGVELRKYKDYEVNITSKDGNGTSGGINVGTVNVEIEGNGNFIGTISKEYSIVQAELTVSGGRVSEKTYDETATANVTEVTFNGLQNNETLELGKDYTVTGAEFDSVEAGDGKTVTGTVTLLDTPKTRNYTLTDGSLSITGQTIAKAAAPAGLDKTIEVVAGLERDYEFDMTALIPKVTGTLGNITYTPSITLNNDGILGALNYQSGNILVLPVQAVEGEGKLAQVKVSIQSGNYNTFDAVITLETVATIPLTIKGITVENKIYDGTDTATLSGTAELVLTNLEPGDKVELSGTPSAVFDDAKTGVNKRVIITGLSLSGDDAYKYHLDLSGFMATIEPKLLTKAMVTIEGGSFTYTGMAQEPVIRVKDNGRELVPYTDYDITYTGNTDVGTANISITGKGNYTGTVSEEFTIVKAAPPADVKGEIEVLEKYPHEYEVKLTDLLPSVAGTLGTVTFHPAITKNSAGLLKTLNYTSGDTLILLVNYVSGTDKTAEVTVKVESDNYQDFNIVITVNTIARPAVNVSDRKDDESGRERSTSVETAKIEMNISGNVVTVTVTAKATVDGSGKETAAFSQAQASEAIDKAMTEAEKLGEGAITRVVLNVEAPANAATIETSIPKDAVSNALKSGISSLTVSTPAGNVTFDSDTLSGLSGEAAEDIRITITRVEASSLSPEALRIIGDRPVYDITVNGGIKEISRFEGEVTVSVPYTPKEGEDINAIVIYYINASGEPEVVTNGIYNPETGMVTFTTRHFSKYGVGYNKISFKDVAESAWYSKAVTFISAREITTGTGGGNFSPEANLTRGQFMVMLMKAYGIAPDPDPKDNFADAGNTYYTGYLAAAKRLNISKGVGNNMFEPEKDITRQEMFTLLYNGLKAMGKLPEGTDGKPLSSFADADSIAPWAYEAMKAMAERGIISGNGGRLNPAGTTTRGEMAQVLYNLLLRR